MKTTILTLIFFSLISCNYGKEVNIDGKIDNLKNTLVFLKMRSQNSIDIIDSVFVVNEKFQFKLINKELAIYFISIPTFKITIAFIPERSIEITGNANSIGSLLVKGSFETNVYNKWNQQTREFGFQWIRVSGEKQKYLEQKDTLSANKLNILLDSLKKEYDNNDFFMIETYPKTYTALFVLSKIYLNLSFKKFKEYLMLIKKKKKNHPLYNILKSKYTILKKTQIGVSAPKFSIESLNSKDIIDLSKINSQYVLLDFWGSWCGPCIKSIPDIKRIFKSYKNDFLQIISIAFDDINDKEKLNDLIEKNKMEWVHGFININDKNNPVIVDYSVISFPTYILIGPDRKILFRDNGTANFDILEKILKDKLN